MCRVYLARAQPAAHSGQITWNQLSHSHRDLLVKYVAFHNHLFFKISSCDLTSLYSYPAEKQRKKKTECHLYGTFEGKKKARNKCGMPMYSFSGHFFSSFYQSVHTVTISYRNFTHLYLIPLHPMAVTSVYSLFLTQKQMLLCRWVWS